jgi:hypothetical protein
MWPHLKTDQVLCNSNASATICVTYPKYGKATTDAVFVIHYQFKHIGVTNMMQSLAVDIAQYNGDAFHVAKIRFISCLPSREVRNGLCLDHRIKFPVVGRDWSGKSKPRDNKN